MTRQLRRPFWLAALAVVIVLLSQLGLERRDDSWLLQVNGQAVDVRGAAATSWQRLWRRCEQVERVPQGDSRAKAALDALRGFSPPDSHSARVLQVDRMPAQMSPDLGTSERSTSQPAAWWALQARFERLEPVVVLVRETATEVQVMTEGVWSGTAQPWDSAWRIRGFLSQRVPNAPTPLLECLDPAPVFAEPPSPIPPPPSKIVEPHQGKGVPS